MISIYCRYNEDTNILKGYRLKNHSASLDNSVCLDVTNDTLGELSGRSSILNGV